MDRRVIIQDFQNAETTVFGALLEAKNRYPDSPAIGFFGKSYNFTQLISETEDTAKGLIEAGVTDSDYVTFMLPNCPQAVKVYYAINRIGAVANMIHTLSSPDNIAYYLNKAESGFIVTLDALYPKVKKALENVKKPVTVIYTSISEEMPLLTKIGYGIKNRKNKPQKITDGNAYSLNELIRSGASRSLPEIRYEKDRVSTIFYSGGTTGVPKGIMLSDYNINSLAVQVANAAGYVLNPGIKFLSAMPLFHGFGLAIGIQTFICNGAQCILVPKFELESFVKTMLKEKTNMMAIVPSLLEAFLHCKEFEGRDLSFLKGIYCGADTTPVELQIKVNKFLKEHGCSDVVREGFGQTEAVTACILNPIDGVKMGSVGLPLGETKVRIVNPGTFEDLPAGEPGEMILNGPTVMLGYLKDEEETRKTVKYDSDGSRWLFTGDICKKDEDGYVFFIQRMSRVIVNCGYKIYPLQIENIINAFDFTEKCCVIGVKDKVVGQKVVVCIILKAGTDPKAAKSAIMKACREHLEEYAVPAKIEVFEEFPLTNVGKTDVKALEKLFEKAGK